MITPKVSKAITSHVHNRYGYLLLVLSLAFISMSCKRETIFTDTAAVKRFEAEKEEAKRQTAQDSLRAAEALKQAAEAREQAAKAEQMGQEAAIAREKLVYEQKMADQKLAQEKELAQQKQAREKEIADQKKALKEEVAAIASASETINVFTADLRSRQGKLQLKLKSLPEEIDQSKADAIYLSKVLSSCRQGVVTNISFSNVGQVKLTNIQPVILKPDEYVKTIKSDPKISSILTRYNNEMFAFELDKVVEELAYETKRLSTSWNMLQNGKTDYDSKQAKANRGTIKSSSELQSELTKIEDRIKMLQFRKMHLESGPQTEPTKLEKKQLLDELGKDGPIPTGLYAEKVRMRRMLELSSNTGLLGDASSSGIGSNFDLHEKTIRDEYQANVRRAFDNVERTVLRTITDKKDAMEQELKSAQDDLAAIQLILDAHAKGHISRNDMLSLHSKYTNSVSESLSAAAKRILE